MGGDDAFARAWVSFLAAAHDVGKASRPFQMLVPELADRMLDPVLAKDGLAAEKVRHDAVSRAILLDCSFTPSWRGLPKDVRAHLIQHLALPTHAEQAPLTSWRAELLPSFDGERADLELNLAAPVRFAVGDW